MTNFNFWEVTFINCEGDKKWSIAMCPEDWTELEINGRLLENSEVSKVISVELTCNEEFGWDFTN